MLIVMVDPRLRGGDTDGDGRRLALHVLREIQRNLPPSRLDLQGWEGGARDRLRVRRIACRS